MSSIVERLAKMTPVEKERTLASIRRINEYVYSVGDMNTTIREHVIEALETIINPGGCVFNPAVIVEAIELDVIGNYDVVYRDLLAERELVDYDDDDDVDDDDGDDDDDDKADNTDEDKYEFPSILLYLCGATGATVAHLTKEARTQIVLALIKSGKCKINAWGKFDTAFTFACKNGYEEIASALAHELLLLSSKIPDCVSYSLLSAVEYNMWSVVKQLIRGATKSYDLTPIDDDAGWSIADWFKEKNMYYDDEIPMLYRAKLFELVDKEMGRDDPPRHDEKARAGAEAKAGAGAEAKASVGAPAVEEDTWLFAGYISTKRDKTITDAEARKTLEELEEKIKKATAEMAKLCTADIFGPPVPIVLSIPGKAGVGAEGGAEGGAEAELENATKVLARAHIELKNNMKTQIPVPSDNESSARNFMQGAVAPASYSAQELHISPTEAEIEKRLTEMIAKLTG